jgi:RNA polymerase sigma factor (sigma-70 family)
LIDQARCRTFLGVTLPALPATTAAAPSSREARLEELFAAHGRAVWAYARRRATAADADDAVSETFLVAWRRLDDVPAEPRAWLLGVARRCLANLSRSETRQSAVRLRLAAQPAPAPSAEGSGAVLSALATLSATDREVLTLLAWDELTPAEVAVVLGCSRAAVYLRLHRARRRLSTLLEQT